MEAHILNVVIGRAATVLTPSLPFPTESPHPSSSSHVSQSTSSSVSRRSTSASSSASTSSPTSESTSFSLSSPTISPSPSSDSHLAVTPTGTVTATIAGSTSPSSSSVAGSPPTGFLQNKVLSWIVFGISGLVGLALLIILAAFLIRRRRNKKLFEDTLNFDPVTMGNYHHTIESGQGESTRASISTGHASHGPEVRQSPAFIDYAPPGNHSYHPALPSMPTYASPSQGQHNTTGQSYTSPYEPQQNRP